MLSEIKEGLSNLDHIKGLRKALWLFLIGGAILLSFESITQYFTTSNLQSRANLLNTLSSINGSSENSGYITAMHNSLIEESKISFAYSSSPGNYLLSRVLRFIKGAYISLPLFYFLFKLFRLSFKFIEKDNYHLPLIIGSMAFSATAWLATILGVISVIFNTSEDILISWFIFPVTSFLLFIPIVLWLILLRLVMPKKKDKQPISSSVQ